MCETWTRRSTRPTSPAFRARQAKLRAPPGAISASASATFSERTGYGTPAFAARGMEMTPGWETVDLAMDPSGFVEARHRRLPARPGPAHDARADHRRRARHHAGAHQDRARRHRPHALRLGHLRQPLAGDRRRREPVGGAQDQRQAAGHGRRISSKRRPTTSCWTMASRGWPAPIARSPSRRWRARPITRPIALPASWRRACARARPTIPPVRSPTPATSRSSRSMWRPERSRSKSYVVAEDAGRLINPMIADGQIAGGVAQGIANALARRNHATTRPAIS